MKTRNDIIDEAIDNCLSEIYEKAQPSFDWKKLKDDCKNDLSHLYKDFWQHHYLPHDEYVEIVEKYINLYRIHNEWKEDADLIISYLAEGGYKDKYFPEQIDKDGFKHPSYRGYENVAPIKNQIGEILNESVEEDSNVLCDKIVDKIFEVINNCKDFYNPHREENGFRMSVMNYSPCSNKNTVEKYWNEQGINMKLYDKCKDPETCEWVLISAENIELWKKNMESFKDYDEYFYEEYKKLVEKYEGTV